ncbi:uncharacterized protein [Argopecten irradians]|uniref:uncharacterized protein n=1 Tax=Argopecten irradians TaxID=31199 RepID=UPI00371473D4
MMFVLLLLSVVPLALSGPVTEHCCLPRQWTATVMENGITKLPDGPAAIDYVTKMTLDLDKNRLRMDRNGFLHNKPEQQTMLVDYGAHRLFFIKDGFCVNTSLAASPPEECLAHNSYKFEGRHHIGSVSNTIISDEWSTSTNANITMTLYISEDCVPIVQVYTDLSSQYPTQTILTYSKFTAGVASADLLTVPANCPS